MGENPSRHEVNTSFAMTVTNMNVAEATVEQLWDLHTIGIRDEATCKTKTEKDDMVREHFRQTVRRTKVGRYSVSLPWMDDKVKIPSNFSVANKRLEIATNKLVSSNLYGAYDKILEGWLDEKIIEVVPPDEISNPCHYLPHRAVVKLQSETTPVRPVFDASCKTGRNASLNDCLEKGPNLLDLIPSLLLRFREGKIGVSSDIRKAFPMVEVEESDRDYLRFLWWESYDQKTLKILRHRRVVFGVTCSPFLLGAVIEYHLDHVAPEEKEAAEKLKKAMYVDNCVTSLDNFKELQHFKDQAIKIMAEALMDLRLWQWSSGEGSGVGELMSSACGLEPGRTAHSTSILGLAWNLDNDSLGCDFKETEVAEKITKRVILSWAHKIFDPIGFLCPVVITPIKLVQETWNLDLRWDDEVNADIASEFKKWVGGVHLLKQVRIPRNFTNYDSNRQNWQLHVFCDASQKSYGAVVFLRVDSGDEVSVQLLQAKARVAPQKKVTIPRLELLACVLAVRLTETVKQALDLQVPIWYWSDSSTALAWIKGNDVWGTFVGNRVKEIVKLSNVANWKHVPGIHNPADLPSRGCTPAQLLQPRWWKGPEWLKSASELWPVLEEFDVDNDEVLKERKKGAVSSFLVLDTGTPWFAERYSSYFKNLRLVAWLKRFVNNANPTKTNNKGDLSVNELRAAELTIWRLVQGSAFCVKDNSIGGLRVAEDEMSGLWIVQSKILMRKDNWAFRKPILLPRNHVMVDQLIMSYHRLNGHAGVQLLMGILREKYWIIQTRRTIKNVISKCVTCRRFSVKKTEVHVAPLPVDRVKTSKVFETVGVDLAGPLFIKKKKKAWIVIFTCAVYRCVHFELVKSLSSEALLEVLARFVSRRGRPVAIYSDNGTNFTGAHNLLKMIDWSKVQRECGMQMIEWKFNPPSAPWWGGWWERIVRMLKEILRRILERRSLPYEKLRSVLCQCEDYINRRPLTVVSEDPDDLHPLTPAMFLYENSSFNITDKDLVDACGFRKLYSEKKSVVDELKIRFRKEYLSLLVHRGKQKPCQPFAVGDIVLVGDDNRKRWDWPLARVMELFPGKNGQTRVARVKTGKGVLVRPLQRLYHLEIADPPDVPELTTDESKIASGVVPVQTKSGREVKKPARFQD